MKNIIITLAIFLTVYLFELQAQNTPANVKTYSPTLAVTTESALNSLTNVQKRMQVQYYDGIGRPVQNIAINASQLQYDVIQAVVYDKYGRQTREYLPYTRNNNGTYRPDPVTEIGTFYNTAQTGSEATIYPYADKEYMNSPLNQIKKLGAQGTNWQLTAHPSQLDYSKNASNNVIKWVMSGDNCTRSGYHTANTLFKTVVKNEKWVSTDVNLNTTEEFTDSRGVVVMKRGYVVENSTTVTVETYYVYDDYGRQRYIITPEAIKQIGSGDITTTISDKYCYWMKYDDRHRVIEKKDPGEAVVYVIYDKLDRVVLTQDGNQRTANKWVFTKYDKLNRPIITGTLVDSRARTTIQTEVNNYTGSMFEVRGLAIHGYSNQSYPSATVANDCLNVYYYDDYLAFSATYNSIAISGVVNVTDIYTQVKGKLTGTKTRIVDNTTWLTNVIYYDKYGRILETVEDNNAGSLEITGILYNFAGQIELTKYLHKVTAGTPVNTITQDYVYDHAGRLKQLYHQIGSGTNVLLSEMEYNELGQLTKKKLHVGTSAVETINYSYNIRGWLKNIDGNRYDESLGFNYDGGISNMQWTTQSGTRNYNLLYDKLNRLIDADYSETTQQSGWTLSNDKYNLNNMTYDRNGNIKSLRRYGWTGSAFNMIDDLVYTYDGNQLLTVADASNNDILGRGDFYELYANGTGDGDEFDYDTNGNMTKDENSSQKFSYNILNLPDLMYYNTGSYPYVDYMYDANGKKLKEYYLYGPGNSKTIDYIGPFVYEQAQGGVNFILTPEGRAVKTGSTYSYEYFLKDHLGNTTVVVNQSGTVLQEKHYYPYGMTFGGTGLASNANRFLYTGKESLTEMNFNFIDFGARMFNPALAVWTTADPMAQYASPYVYCGDDPVSMVDPTGMWSGDADRDEQDYNRRPYLDGGGSRGGGGSTGFSAAIYRFNAWRNGMRDERQQEYRNSFVVINGTEVLKSDVLNIYSDGNVNFFGLNVMGSRLFQVSVALALAQIYATGLGQIAIDKCAEGTPVDIVPLDNDKHKSPGYENNTIYFGSTGIYGAIFGALSEGYAILNEDFTNLGHEIWHAYIERRFGKYNLDRAQQEQAAIGFENYLANVFGYSYIRRGYPGIGILWKDQDAKFFNRENEKIVPDPVYNGIYQDYKPIHFINTLSHFPNYYNNRTFIILRSFSNLYAPIYDASN